MVHIVTFSVIMKVYFVYAIELNLKLALGNNQPLIIWTSYRKTKNYVWNLNKGIERVRVREAIAYKKNHLKRKNRWRGKGKKLSLGGEGERKWTHLVWVRRKILYYLGDWHIEKSFSKTII
jgi:hypothetical protein